MSARETDPLIYRFFTEIGIIEQLARNKLEQELPDGITMAQFTVLQHFARLGGEKTPLSLARAMQVTKGTMTNTLQRLEARELIKVRPDPADGRGKLVSSTTKGRKLRDRAVAKMEPELERFTIAFGNGAIEEALPFLQKVRNFLDEDRN
ncbi:MAG: MarR family transcriptional regulator [Rhizobiales bacterium]|nr:MarR family transcriptional regulator [Hyphomicrobiales bacterium]